MSNEKEWWIKHPSRISEQDCAPILLVQRRTWEETRALYLKHIRMMEAVYGTAYTLSEFLQTIDSKIQSLTK